MYLHQDGVRAIQCAPFHNTLPEVHAQRLEPGSEQNHTPTQVGSLALVSLFLASPYPIPPAPQPPSPPCPSPPMSHGQSESLPSVDHACLCMMRNLCAMLCVFHHCQKHSLSLTFTVSQLACCELSEDPVSSLFLTHLSLSIAGIFVGV